MKKSVFSSAATLVLAASFLFAACDEVLKEKELEDVIEKNEIANINFSGLISPVKDGVPATELVVPETADYTVGAIEWKNAKTDEVVSSEAKFAAGVSYRAAVLLTAKEGKSFAAASKAKVGQIQIGDSESEIASYKINLVETEALQTSALAAANTAEKAILTVTYKAAPAKPAIKTMRGANKAYVSGLRAPAIGETPRTLSNTPEYAELNDAWDDKLSGILDVPFSSAGFTVVYDPALTKWLNADTPFVAGKEYKAQITLRASGDRVFGDKLDVLFAYTKVTQNYTSSDLEESQIFAKKVSTVSADHKTAQVVLTFKSLQATE
ncbi:MAG: hypothetical protein Ta2B_01190 [Termitinemataceae bacterium]|nr:MAG: hypothetical protein Ta2B_01190 [Termitinemataceae bacterium]